MTGEARKILQSPRYFLQNYVYIRSKDLGLHPLFPLWDSQEIFLTEFEKQYHQQDGRVRIICLKARQVGVTTLSVSILFWLAVTRPLVHCLSMSDEDARTVVNAEMARSAWENLPWWFRPEKRYDVHGKLLGFDRAKQDDRHRVPGLRSQIYFESANQPSGAAYSKSVVGAHLAEVSRYRTAKSITEGVFGSLVSMAGSIGIMESTAQGRHDVWHRLCRRAEEGRMPWKFVFLEWFREPGYTVQVSTAFERTKEEDNIALKVKEEANYELTDGQLAWRRLKMEEFESAEGSTDKFSQEFPLTPREAFVASGNCAFSKRRLHEMTTRFVRPPIWVGNIALTSDNKDHRITKVEDGNFSVWEWPEKNVVYYVSGDPSMGVESGDPACAEVLAVPEDINEPLRQVAEWHGWLGPTNFARVLAAIGYLYNTAEIAPECNAITTVASDLVKVLMYPRWYRWMREDKARNMYSSWIGWQTTHRNRNEIIGRFRDALNEWTIIVRSARLIEECYDFVDDDTPGHFEARRGGRDDAVMSTMIGYYCATQLRPHLGYDLEEVQFRDPNKNHQNSDDFSWYDSPDRDGLPAFEEL